MNNVNALTNDKGATDDKPIDRGIALGSSAHRRLRCRPHLSPDVKRDEKANRQS